MRRWWKTPLLGAVLTVVCVPSVAAQASRADSAAVLIEASRDLRERGEPGASEALLRFLLDRFGDTPSAAQARADLEATQNARSSSVGRVELQVWSALYGIFVGVAAPAAASAEGKALGIGLILGGPVGLLIATNYSRGHGLSAGQTRAITLGGTWGTFQGWGWAAVADVGDGDRFCDGQFCGRAGQEERQIWFGLLGGAAGLITGAYIAHRPISPGMATTANLGALWGTWFGLAGGYVSGLENDQLRASTLLVGNAGLAASVLLGRNWNLTRSRARLISISGVLGGLAGGGIDMIAQFDNSKVAVALPLATSIAGLAIGALATRDRAPEGARDDDSFAPDALSSLFSLSEGRLNVGLPLPTPERMLLSAVGGDRLVVTQRVNLFTLRF